MITLYYFNNLCLIYISVFFAELQTDKEILVNVQDLNDNAPVFAQNTNSSFVIAEVRHIHVIIKIGETCALQCMGWSELWSAYQNSVLPTRSIVSFIRIGQNRLCYGLFHIWYLPIFFEDLLGCQFYNLQTYSWNYIIFVYVKYLC